MTIEQRIEKIYNNWFLAEPALHAILCCHNVCQNNQMQCPIRSGKGKIEYNQQLIEQATNAELEELFRAEAIRLMLKHPYERQPANCPPDILTIASNITITNNYFFKHIKLDKASDKNLPSTEYFEYFALMLLDQQYASADSDKKSNQQNHDNNQSEPKPQPQALSDQSALWTDDENNAHNINRIIEQTKNWGTLPSNLVAEIIASTQAKIDYRKILCGFRASVISTRRSLTRMRPNRRTGFQNMGSIYHLSTKLLVAIDVSGSVSDASISDFLSIVNRFFKYGIQTIDVAQFDCQINKITTLHKAKKSIEINGRGGTNFQILFDFIATHSEYDGMIILTDGYAPHPTKPNGCRTKILWICDSADSYNAHNAWMSETGRCCAIQKK